MVLALSLAAVEPLQQLVLALPLAAVEPNTTTGPCTAICSLIGFAYILLILSFSQENALISLLKRDDLQMEEGKIWNYVIKWGIAQNQGLPSDPEDWTLENFQALKTTLQNCLPLIRYFQISGNDIVDNVQPYQPILEKNLWKDIMKRIADPNRPISSIVLPPRIILTPIDEKTTTYYSTRNNPYKFRLLLRGSRDGFTADIFWNLCDKKENVVLIIKVKGTDEILGGYNPIGWEKPITFNYISCDKCFIFSLRNGTIQNSILSRAKSQHKTIKNNFLCGPSFHYDLVSFNHKNKSYCQHASYEKPIRNVPVDKHNRSCFSLEDYEIFQINNKHAE
ncbi:hypothetical protein C2G38_2173856 [Gigaspora rosea]|uniref:TLDc domain-containing protein n=1 Tax=Gigaspora rosea TaxID=44941 RepID=A0A397VJ40_9GLOM|nr:hypothetical protein C2G38_2173856 [Gigaspora rosea]